MLQDTYTKTIIETRLNIFFLVILNKKNQLNVLYRMTGWAKYSGLQANTCNELSQFGERRKNKSQTVSLSFFFYTKNRVKGIDFFFLF